MFSFNAEKKTLAYVKIEYAFIDDVLPSIANVPPTLKSGKFWQILPTIAIGLIETLFNKTPHGTEIINNAKGIINPFVANLEKLRELQAEKFLLKLHTSNGNIYVGSTDFPALFQSLKIESINKSRKIEYTFIQKSPYHFIETAS